MDPDTAERLKEIEDRARQCTRCPLHETRTNAVPGEGGYRKRIMLIGEAPGRTEDELGRPFVGKAGQFLDTLLQSIGLSREDVYITNVLKCRPPNNRDPKPDEVVACSPFLEEQLRILDPVITVTLGRHSWKWACEHLGITHKKLSEVHGQVFYSSTIVYGQKIVIPVFHPATALYRKEYKEILRKDFTFLGKIIDDVLGGRAPQAR